MIFAPFTIDLDLGGGWCVATDIECRAITTNGRTVDAVLIDTSKYQLGEMTSYVWRMLPRPGEATGLIGTLADIAWAAAQEADLRGAWDDAEPCDRQGYNPYSAVMEAA